MSNKNVKRLVFPSKLGELVDNGREYVCFKMLQTISVADEQIKAPKVNAETNQVENAPPPPQQVQIGENIFLPMPVGFSAGDSASFGDFSGNASKAVKAVANGSTLSNADMLLASMKGLDAVTGGIASDFTDPLLAEQGVAFNNATTVKFDGNEIRTFSFAYKLVPSNQQESDVINHIINTFRLASYAKTKGVFALEYPPQFQIRFYVNREEENQYYPNIHNCYLTSVEVNYNTEGNIFYINGAPTAVELSLSFTETRQLTRDDVESRSSIKFNTTPTTRG